MTGVVRICAPPEGPGLWDEPFIVSSDDETHDCEGQEGCPKRSRWMVEVVGYQGDQDPPPYLHPVRYTCDEHLVAGMEDLCG